MKKLLKIFSLMLAGTLVFSCEKPEQLGPDVKGIYGPVTVTQPLTVSNNNPDFSASQTVYFSASFENDAIWTLTLVGQTSGAVKTIQGVSKVLGSYNASWDGTADDAPSFLAENVIITLSFKSSTVTSTTNLTIAGKKNLDAGGVLVTDFAPGHATIFPPPPLNSPPPAGWVSDWPVSSTTTTDYSNPDGNNYMLMGDAGGWTPEGTPYVDFLTIPAKYAKVDYGTYFPLYADPSKVYLNLMVYATSTADTWLRVAAIEEGDIARYIDIRPDWTGWKLISVNYTELLSDAADAPKPTKVKAIQLILFTDSATLPGPNVRTAFDHIIFTHNKPYQP